MKGVILTGANRGLGITIAKQLLSDGFKLWVPVRTLSHDLVSLRDQFPNQIELVTADFQDIDSLSSKLKELFITKETAIHGLVNNAAIAYDELVTNSTHELIEKMFRVNVFAPMEFTKVAIKNMLLHKTRGSLIHISSVCSQTGYKGLSMYSATKGALEAYSRGVAREWGRFGIRSNCVLPGFMETAMSSGLDDRTRDKIYQRTSLKQPTDPNSVAATVSFLLHDASSSITGQNFIVDSGTL